MTIYISRASILTLIVCLNFTLWTWPDVVATQVGPKIATRLENDVGSCPPLTLDMLGNNAEASTDGIIAAILSACVRVIQFHILCETPGLMKGTISSVSFLAEYRCIGITCQNVNSGDFETHIDQFQIRCNYNDGNFSFIFPNVSVATGSTISRNFTANFTTPPRYNCSQCLDPSVANSVPGTVDVITHCYGMYNY